MNVPLETKVKTAQLLVKELKDALALPPDAANQVKYIEIWFLIGMVGPDLFRPSWLVENSRLIQLGPALKSGPSFRFGLNRRIEFSSSPDRVVLDHQGLTAPGLS